ncbi:DUF1294 domain-containing protein [Cytobacillus sp. FJAT-54145]|uniref:DUF1294 domain-containing protein n=1 Tax=Cytobacillus spartinae TaxID=3299023 RepID=A0ABW6KJL7_9BACI
MITYLLFIYLVLVNLIGLYLMYTDKKRSMLKQYRISEKTLWQTAILGGVLGVTVGMRLFRHKTKHPHFKWGLPLLLIIEGGIIYFFLLIY